MEDAKQKSKALELAIANVEKEFGKGAIMRLGEGDKIGGDVPQTISTFLTPRPNQKEEAINEIKANTRCTKDL